MSQPLSELSPFAAMIRPIQVHELVQGWSFKQTDDGSDDAWLSVGRVPTNVHLDLIAHKK